MRGKPKKNTTGAPREVPEDVREKQDPKYDERDLLSAIKRVSRKLDPRSFARDRE